MKIERFNTEQIEQLLASKRAQLEEEFQKKVFGVAQKAARDCGYPADDIYNGLAVACSQGEFFTLSEGDSIQAIVTVAYGPQKALIFILKPERLQELDLSGIIETILQRSRKITCETTSFSVKEALLDAGFRVVGIQQDEALIDGELRDTVILEKLRDPRPEPVQEEEPEEIPEEVPEVLPAVEKPKRQRMTEDFGGIVQEQVSISKGA